MLQWTLSVVSKNNIVTSYAKFMVETPINLNLFLRMDHCQLHIEGAYYCSQSDTIYEIFAEE